VVGRSRRGCRSLWSRLRAVRGWDLRGGRGERGETYLGLGLLSWESYRSDCGIQQVLPPVYRHGREHTVATTINQSSHQNVATIYLESKRKPIKVKAKADMIITVRMISALREGTGRPLQMRFWETNVAAV
jgi:hypothetical protein